jgi:hypothetical protein
MAVPVPRQCASAVTELSEDACVGSSSAQGTTLIPVDLRQHAFPQALGPPARLCWRKASSHVDGHALSTFPQPITSRFLLAQGSSLDAQNPRRDCPPAIKGGSTAQPMSPRVSRLACDRAVVWGVSRWHIALLFSVLFVMPLTQASLKRWLDALGAP